MVGTHLAVLCETASKQGERPPCESNNSKLWNQDFLGLLNESYFRQLQGERELSVLDQRIKISLLEEKMHATHGKFLRNRPRTVVNDCRNSCINIQQWGRGEGTLLQVGWIWVETSFGLQPLSLAACPAEDKSNYSIPDFGFLVRVVMIRETFISKFSLHY